MTSPHATSLPFTQVDAFADAPFAGNPAAVMPLDAWLDDATSYPASGPVSTGGSGCATTPAF